VSPTPPPRAVLLDALGTLVELAPPAPSLRDGLVRELGVEVSLTDAQRAIEAEIAYYRAHLDEGRDRASLARLRRACGEALRAALPSSAGLRRASPEAVTGVLLASLRFRAFEDVRPALEALRLGRIHVVVVSNWDVSLHDVLARLELTALLDGVLTSAEAGARKPAREIFEQALGLAGVDPGDAVHVGDSVAEDVEGARAAGISPILVRRGSEPEPPGTAVVATLTELIAHWARARH
jgi:putative hydrolase of the HAD superfamily